LFKGKVVSKKTLYPFKTGQGQGQALQSFSEILCFFCGKTTFVKRCDGTVDIKGFCVA